MRPVFEEKWQRLWEKHGVYRVADPKVTKGKSAAYALEMFPYPSAEGLHVGHPEGYTASDIYSRYLRMNGKSVLHPMGFDSFGLPAENYAIKTGTHPAISTKKNIDNMRRQIKSFGFSYDWDREVITSDPTYYKWTQWIFLKLFEAGLAYEAEAPINWCPKDKTGLANEEVVGGKCERCGTQVEKKNIRQWLVKITDERYIERLLHGHDNLDWPESLKLLQRNWIGRSEGAEVTFDIPFSSRIVFMHGKHAQANQKWYTDFYTHAEKKGYEVIAHDLPNTDEPEISEWLAELDKAKPDETTILVGHSRGCSAILRWLEKQPKARKVAKVILVAPSLGDSELSSKGFYGKSYNYKKIIQHCDAFAVIHSEDDPVVPYASGVKNAKGLNAKLFTLQHRGHFDSHDPITQLYAELHAEATVFTTRPDTLFGATYMVLSPEHSLVTTITTDKQKKAVEKYQKDAKKKSDLERTDLAKEKTGVFTGSYAINPVNGEKIPVWIADYVLATYGTGAIMAVPAHDERDFAFAKKYKLPIIYVVEAKEKKKGELFIGNGIAINSGKFNGESTEDFKKKIIAWLEKEGKGKKAVNYKLRDWVFSRQRYWGEPIPIIHCDDCGNVAVPEKDLPVVLPNVKKYEPTGTGESPLASIKDWVNVQCPNCKKAAKRETNTMPQWAGSNWYFMRYCDPHNKKQLADPKKLAAWLPVDVYTGGAEHAVLHFLYARFIYKFLYDSRVVPKECGDEPFIRVKNQGLIMGEDGQKMSKSRGNVINPDAIVKEYGADVMRMYEMFMGPFEDAKPWDTKGMIGIKRFLDRVNELTKKISHHTPVAPTELTGFQKQQQIVKKITEDIEQFHFNTAISSLMVYSNYLREKKGFARNELQTLLILLSPFAPHIAEELWQKIHEIPEEKFSIKNSIVTQPWPKFDESNTKEVDFTLVVMINGKKRDDFMMPTDTSEADIRRVVHAREKVQPWISGKKIQQERYIKGRIYSIVVT